MILATAHAVCGRVRSSQTAACLLYAFWSPSRRNFLCYKSNQSFVYYSILYFIFSFQDIKYNFVTLFEECYTSFQIDYNGDVDGHSSSSSPSLLLLLLFLVQVVVIVVVLIVFYCLSHFKWNPSNTSHKKLYYNKFYIYIYIFWEVFYSLLCRKVESLAPSITCFSFQWFDSMSAGNMFSNKCKNQMPDFCLKFLFLVLRFFFVSVCFIQ